MKESVTEFRHDSKIPYRVTLLENPTQEELRALSLEHVPHIHRSCHGNLNRITRCKARLAHHTHIIAPTHEAGFYSSHVMPREQAQQLIDHQREYIERIGTLVRIDGYQGLGVHAPSVQWLYTPDAANLAGMQQVLAFPRNAVETEEELQQPFRPHFRLIMTPGCPAPGSPPQVAILVDLENWTTYVLGSDYFGESKKGMLRMLNEYVYQLGGLVLHAGAKVVTVDGRRVMTAIMGLSGTGKTTTTFSHQGESTEPIQDDMICIWPDGSCTVTENGCFAKTYGLREETEPVIYRGTIHPHAWIENVYMNADDTYDFSKDSLSPQEVARWWEALIHAGAPRENVDAYVAGKIRIQDVMDEYDVPLDGWDFLVWTQNGRSIIPMSAIANAARPDRVAEIQSLGILNRDEGEDAATPGVVRFASPFQAAAYFMLGETSKTSAAGKERGKTRSPFTQPFFPRVPHLQAARFEELASRMPELQLWLMNTGFVGGDQRDVAAGRALKVKIAHSSAMLEHLLAERITWKDDPDFGYQIVDVEARENQALLKRVPDEILNPRLFYQRHDRLDEYRAWVDRIKEERRGFLERMGVGEEILRHVDKVSGL
jgi:phosphoenolpyruvate carboxykinase (ATP)